jgi:hypothetical protein
MSFCLLQMCYCPLLRLHPDILLPEQLLALRDTPPHGAKRLLLAMLEDALHCFQVYLLAD